MANLRELIWRLEVKDADSFKKKVKDAEKAVDGVKDATSKADKSTRKFGDTFKKDGTSLKKHAKEIDKIGKSWTKATAPLTAMGVAGFKMAGDLDTAIRKVSTLTNEEILPVSQIKKDIREISESTGIAQTEIGESMYEALSAGVDQTNLKEFTKSAVNLTDAGFTDMTTAIDATTTVLNAYGDAADEVTKIHDIMVKTQDKGKITVDQLGQNMGRVIPTASSLGVNLDQLGASYAMLTAKGQNPAIATTNLNALFKELGSTGSDVDKVLRKKTGKSFKELTNDGTTVGEVLSIIDTEAQNTGKSLSDMFGASTAGTAALTLLSEGVEGYNDVLKEMQESDGATAANAEKMIGQQRKMRKAMNQVKIAMTDVGAALAPFIIQAAEGISKIVKKFTDLDDETKSSIVQWGALIAAIGPALMIFSKIITVISFLATVFGVLLSTVVPIALFFGKVLAGAFLLLTTPIGLTVSAIGLLVGIGANLYNNWGRVKERAEELGGGIGGYLKSALIETGNMFVSLKNKAVSALDGIKDKWQSVKDFLKNPIKGTISIFSKETKSGDAKPDGSHASGLNSVPFDNYLGNLHAGEMVLPAQTANRYRALGGDIHNIPTNTTSNTSSTNFAPVINVTVAGNADGYNIASAVRDEMENMFRNLNLQRA